MRIPLRGHLRIPTVIIATSAATAVLATATSAAAVTVYVKLNQTNYGTAQTTIKNSNGTPLGLYAKSGYPPLYVNSTKAVPRLNADYVDGLHASAFARATGKTGVIANYNAPAICPKGTVLTGGGGLATASTLAYSGPALNDAGDAFIPNSWEALDASGPAYSFAVCYNPKGAVPGALSAMALSTLTKASAGLLAKLKSSSPSPTASGSVSPSTTASPSPSSSPAG